LDKICAVIKKYDKKIIVDAMSSFGALPIDVAKHDIDYLVSSANKGLEGVPGFGFTIAKIKQMQDIKDVPCRSLSLDLNAQWNYLEKNKGGFRFTSPVHAIRALNQALAELEEEGGIEGRYKRYSTMQRTLSDGMKKLGFKVLDLKGYQGPILTTFH